MEHSVFSPTFKKLKQIVFKQQRKPFSDKTNSSPTCEKTLYVKVQRNNYIEKLNNTNFSSVSVKLPNLSVGNENVIMSDLKIGMNLKEIRKENIPIINSEDEMRRKKPIIKTPIKNLTNDDILELLQCDVVQPTPPQMLNKKKLNKSLRKCLLNRSIRKQQNIDFDSNSNQTNEIVKKEETSPVKKVNNTNDINSISELDVSSVNIRDTLEDTTRNKTVNTSKMNLRRNKKVDYAAMVRGSSFFKTPEKFNKITDLKVLIPKMDDSYIQQLNISNASEIIDNLNKKIPIYKSLNQNAVLSDNEKNRSEIYEFEYDSNEDHKVTRKKKVLKKLNKNKAKIGNIFFSNKSNKIKIPVISIQKNAKANAKNVCNNIPVQTSTLHITNKNIQQTVKTTEDINNIYQNQIEDDNDIIESSEILDSEFCNVEQSIEQTILEDFSNIENQPSVISNFTTSSDVKSSPWRLNGPTIKSSMLFETNKSMLPCFNQDLLITEMKSKVYISPDKITLKKHQNSLVFQNDDNKVTEQNQTKNVETESIQVKETSKEVDQENISSDVLLTQSKKKRSRQTTILSFMNLITSKSTINNKSVTATNSPLNIPQINIVSSENESTPSENRPSAPKDFPFTPIRRSERRIRKPLQLLNENISKNNNSIVDSITDKNSSEDSLFGFKSLEYESMYKTKHKKNRTDNMGPARVSVRTIREIFNKNQEVEEKNEVETVDPIIKPVETVSQKLIVENKTIQNTELIKNTEVTENSVDKIEDNVWMNTSSDDDEKPNKDCNEDENGIQGVGLFEESDFLISRQEVPRRSYIGKIKRKRRVHYESDSDSDKDTSPHTPKKKKKKNLRTKKEEEEAERWAQQFNSMCEEVEQFELLVE